MKIDKKKDKIPPIFPIIFVGLILIAVNPLLNNLSKFTRNSILNNSNDNTYNYYELALQRWCIDNQSFHIHGLWPQITNSSYPTYCANIPFNPDLPNDMLQRMNDVWNRCENNTELWEHEWTKHGTCFSVQTGLSQLDFFNITLNIFDQIKNTSSDKCGDVTECIVGCFNLNYVQMSCPN